MHICFITNEYPKEGFPHGGIGTFVRTIAQDLVKRNVRVSVIGLNYDQTFEKSNIKGVEILRLKKSKVRGLSWYINSRAIQKAIITLHKEKPIDIIESAELALAFLPKLENIKYFIRLHGGHHFFAEAEQRGVNWWKGYQEKKSFKKADAFIAVSNYVKSHTAKFLSYNNKPIDKIYYPLDFSHFQPREISVEENNITFAGTVCEKKGIRQLIQAFPLIKEHFPNTILNVYGRDWFFPDGSSYIKMLQEIELPKLGGLVKDIVFHGAISNTEIPKAYAKAAVCVFPSHMETLGLVAPEAMAMKKAVVFTNLGPGPEVINDGLTGFLCNPHNPEDIANKIIKVLKNPHLAKEIGDRARESVLKQFEINTIVKENIEFYKKILATDNQKKNALFRAFLN